jgi:hypothetical protein
MYRVAFAAKERRGFIERQSYDAGIGTDDFHDKRAGDALRRVATGLAAPLSGGEVGLDVFIRQPLEAHPRLHVALPKRLLRRHQAHCGVDAMIAAGQEPQTLRGFVE